uniref:RELT like 1 n=1 Tax=Gasterosteus aculeatus aculeatus TaxID=481459 RepID=G3Q6K8_GASAC
MSVFAPPPPLFYSLGSWRAAGRLLTQTTVSGEGDAASSHPDYTAFVLVPVFFLLGLLGVVICHVLKRKGYRCTTDHGEEEVEEEEEKDPELGGDMNDTLSENNDTVGQIVHYIMKNEGTCAPHRAANVRLVCEYRPVTNPLVYRNTLERASSLRDARTFRYFSRK